MLVRFCILRRDSASHSPQGVFQAAIQLREDGKLERYEEEWLERELSWLRMHLPSPDCLRDDGNERAICWFKPEAKRPIEKVRGIVALLETKGIPVETVTTAEAGTIIYEDKWQVVAKPRGDERAEDAMAHQGEQLEKAMLLEIVQVLRTEREYANAARHIDAIEARYTQSAAAGENLGLRRSAARESFIAATDKGASFEEVSARFQKMCELGFSSTHSELCKLLEFAHACGALGHQDEGLRVLAQASKRLPESGLKRQDQLSAQIETCRQRLEDGTWDDW